MRLRKEVMFVENKQRKNSAARIRANNKYTKLHYINVCLKIKPEERDLLKQKKP